MPPAAPSIAVSGKPTFYVVMGTLHVLRDENLAVKKRGLLAYARNVREEYSECRQSWAAQDLEDERLFHLYQEWDSKDHFRAACKIEPRRIVRGTPGYDLSHDEGIMLTYLTCTQFPLPDTEVPKSPMTRWAYMDSMLDLTKREGGQPAGELFLLSLRGKGGKPDEHAIFNNTADKQFLAKMRFPGQDMVGAQDPRIVRRVKFDRGPGRAPDVAFEVSVLPGHTVPFVRGKFTGQFGFSYKFGPPVDPEFLDGVALKMQERVNKDVDTFKTFLRQHLKATPELMPPPPGQAECARDLHLYQSDRFIAAAARLCVQHHHKFVDLQWWPCQERISRTSAVPPEPRAPVRGWLRPEDWLPDPKDDYDLIINQAEPNDIDQGQLGDCWFMASIAACAESCVVDQLVLPMFMDVKRRNSPDDEVRQQYLTQCEQERHAGLFRILLAKQGVWKWHVVDTFLPVTPVRSPEGPCFAHNKEEPREMWVSMLEKCYAKICGSYQSISGGDPAVALSDLTGFPCRTFEWEEPAFSRFLSHDHKARMLWVTTPGQDTSSYMGGSQNRDAVEFADMYDSIGLVAGHAYTVVHVVEWPDGDDPDDKRPKTKLMNIRNPWGNDKEWNGRWSDRDSAWDEYPDVAKACAAVAELTVEQWNLRRLSEDANDGAFWMEWVDVMRYFNGGGVCLRCDPSWQDLRFRTKFTQGLPEHIIRIQPTVDCEAFLFGQQVDRRGRLDKYRDLCALRLDVITPKKRTDDPKQQNYELLATSNPKGGSEKGAGKFVFSHQVVAHGIGESVVDVVKLRKGRVYYMIMRQYTNEVRESLLDRDCITLVIQSSRQAGESLRGVTPLIVSESMKEAFKYQGYHGLDVRSAKADSEVFCQLNKEQVWPRDEFQPLPVCHEVTSVSQLS
eukprot:TRINITY_DN11514_c0_g1_i1.p1 TRINITY_DN11514_c0_g1~~TRINITY_DN11514_c0_g1_i1.p1  ORF type:complete len:917 (+),score=288.08 TRINITY_DN11514_c0_g1_i1:58-2751(+)